MSKPKQTVTGAVYVNGIYVASRKDGSITVGYYNEKGTNVPNPAKG